MRRRLVRILAGLATIAIALAVWAFWIEPGRLVLREVELVLPDWPAADDGLRVAVLTDLHVGSPRNGLAHLDRVVALTNGARPDLVLIAGDLVIQGVAGGRFVAPEDIAPRLARLRAPLGIHAVLGNHDWWLDAPRVAAALADSGIRLLEDTATVVAAPAPFFLAGVSDLWEGAHDIPRALADVPDRAPVVLFTHNPDIFPDVPARVTLTVAGHTHGGQVDLPFVGPPVVPSRYGQRYAAGHIVEDGRHLFVATGVGTSILPVRFRVPPAIVILTLTAAERP